MDITAVEATTRITAVAPAIPTKPQYITKITTAALITPTDHIEATATIQAATTIKEDQEETTTQTALTSRETTTTTTGETTVATTTPTIDHRNHQHPRRKAHQNRNPPAQNQANPNLLNLKRRTPLPPQRKKVPVHPAKRAPALVETTHASAQ